jgi:hypothetical protein
VIVKVKEAPDLRSGRFLFSCSSAFIVQKTVSVKKAPLPQRGNENKAFEIGEEGIAYEGSAPVLLKGLKQPSMVPRNRSP